LVRSKMRRFKGSPGPANTFAAFWPAQNANYTRSRSRCFKWSNGPSKSFYNFWSAQNATWVN
jgi:hypothetical protein